MAQRPGALYRRLIAVVFAGIVACGLLPPAGIAQEQAGRDDSAESRIDYAAEIKPLLRERCYACHGALKQEAGLRLDTVEAMLRGGDSGPVVRRADPAASLLLERVSANDIAVRMPPEFEAEPLSPQQISLLRDWIAAGALSPQDEQPEADPREHWAFQPIVRPPVPVSPVPDSPMQRAGWGRTPIDAFVARQHARHGLTPQPEASRRVLLRRLSLDLTGLPLTAEEIAAFESDSAPDWYERAVERLLNDPAYGERWARHWMDIWRYSDSWGLGDQLRNSQPHIWHWRDWIVESLNADAPYDEMVRSMLAADELYPNDLDKLRATGYLARNYFLFNRNQWMDETVEHVGKGFLGLTMNCAKCHDHKYDPIVQTDYYAMRAFFEPYHARLDVLPGEPDLSRDGIPRVFDGLPDEPTYRFIRGDESRPDESAAIPPGIPAILEFEPLEIDSVELPPEAWQPERRPWVAEAYRTAALRKVEQAQERLDSAREKLAAAERSEPALEAEPNAEVHEGATGADVGVAARLELQVAESAWEAAEAELRSIERRAVAMRAAWERTDCMDPGEGAEPDEAEREAARAAVRAERERDAAQARLALAEAELRLHGAADDKREAIAKDVAAKRDALEASLRQVEEPGEDYTAFVGAQWTPTRFFNSTADDPAVPFLPRSTGRRTALAEWITDRRHPLTARVAVNHIWMRHFGTPLVPTVFDFGRNGSPPTNPELLDWLAAELIDSGWSMKHLHRLIVQSATYRLSSSSAGAEANIARDPDNIHSWRRTPVRLESQAVRDSVLALAGTLDPASGGPPVPPSEQAGSNRRSLYFFHSNNDRNLFLTTFDEALVKECYRREQSIVPQQALALANSGLVLDAAPHIAARLMRDLAARGQAADDDRAFIRLAFAVLLAAEPNDAEIAAAAQALEAWKSLPEAPPGEGAGRFARENFVWVLLNHNDFVTLR